MKEIKTKQYKAAQTPETAGMSMQGMMSLLQDQVDSENAPLEDKHEDTVLAKELRSDEAEKAREKLIREYDITYEDAWDYVKKIVTGEMTVQEVRKELDPKDPSDGRSRVREDMLLVEDE
jgi:hypothetical protein